MAKTPKRPRDPNQLAKMIADIATGDVSDASAPESEFAKRGREGGLIGGRAGAQKLTPEQRSAFARKVASARWARR